MQVSPPKYVTNVLNTLAGHGYSAYLVGGCVRDIILGTAPNDWDVATSALPQQILNIFPGSLTIGMKHGTVTVKQGKDLVEVTTFRLDGDYSDHRHPKSVSFVTDLSEDLSRRDFTINAIALDKNNNIVDPFHGCEDIDAGIIRAVGDPDKRFEEDALRMFRAFRFSSRLGFTIEKHTLDAIYKNAGLSSALSAERIRDELMKVLVSDHPEYVHFIIDCRLLDTYLDGNIEYDGSFDIISKLGKDAMLRLCMLCFLLKKCGYIVDVKAFLEKLKLDGTTIRYIPQSLEIMGLPVPVQNTDYKKLLSKYDLIPIENALQCIDLLCNRVCVEELESVISSNECCHIKDMDIKGTDVMAIGFKGKEVGQVMNALLDYVIENPHHNSRDVLLSVARSLKEK